MRGRVFQINVSNGGVPKSAVPKADVHTLGISSDKQNDLRYHGGPDRALVLYSLERVLDLQEEGHPIYPGAIGENVTVTGLDWPLIVPGDELRLGVVLVEVTGYASPCSKIGPAFRDETFSRVSQKTNPGWSRLTCRVLQPGRISVGDGVEHLPAGFPF